MKRANRQKSSDCPEVEQLLLKQQNETLAETERVRVEAHLATCSHCQQFGQNLQKLHASLAVEQEGLTPDPAIRDNLLQRIRAVKMRKRHVVPSRWRRLMDIRIPAYQAALAVLVVGLLIFIFDRVPLPAVPRPAPPNATISVQPQIRVPFHVVDYLGVLARQKIGMTVSEDSLLTRYIRAM